jgi:hypothetical protein
MSVGGEETWRDRFQGMSSEGGETWRDLFRAESERVWDEILSAMRKHGSRTPLSSDMDSFEKLAILGEEFGEVCHSLTYDDVRGGAGRRKELRQVAAVALMWLMAEAGRASG